MYPTKMEKQEGKRQGKPTKGKEMRKRKRKDTRKGG